MQYFASVQIINQQPCITLLRPTNIFSYCGFGVWASEIFVWGAPPLLPPPDLRPGPQREIFPGGTKIDAGPPKLGEVQTNKSKKGLYSNLVPFFSQKQVKSKKKVFTQIWFYFLPKSR